MDLTAAQALPRPADLTPRQRTLRNSKIDRKIAAIQGKAQDSSLVAKRRLLAIDDRYEKKVTKATGFLNALREKEERYAALDPPRPLPPSDRERVIELEGLLNDGFATMKALEVAAVEKALAAAKVYYTQQIAFQENSKV